jgi:large subunit ribosomal protein L10
MEMAVRTPRPEKVAVVDEVKGRFHDSSAAILTEYRGLSVADLETLRRSLREAGGEYKVYKNTLVRRAADDIGLADLNALLEGPTAIAFVQGDVAAVAKVLRDFARTNPNLVVKGGLIGSSLIDAGSAAALADLPSREVLLAQLAGMLAAPMQRFASLLQAVPQRFAYALAALGRERSATEPEAAPANDASVAAEAAESSGAPEAVLEAPGEVASADPASVDPVSVDAVSAEELVEPEAAAVDAPAAPELSAESGAADEPAESTDGPATEDT